jgi:hypothetical protein
MTGMRMHWFDDAPPKTRRLWKASLGMFFFAMLMSNVLDIWLDTMLSTALMVLVMLAVLLPLAHAAKKERAALEGRDRPGE